MLPTTASVWVLTRSSAILLVLTGQNECCFRFLFLLLGIKRGREPGETETLASTTAGKYIFNGCGPFATGQLRVCGRLFQQRHFTGKALGVEPFRRSSFGKKNSNIPEQNGTTTNVYMCGITSCPLL